MTNATQVGGEKSKLIGFYSGATSDDQGRRLADIQAWGFDEIEHTHDYIQWMFPLRKHSSVNPSAPVLDAKVIAAFRSRQDLRDAFVRSLETMLRFYGFELDGSGDEPGAMFGTVRSTSLQLDDSGEPQSSPHNAHSGLLADAWLKQAC